MPQGHGLQAQPVAFGAPLAVHQAMAFERLDQAVCRGAVQPTLLGQRSHIDSRPVVRRHQGQQTQGAVRALRPLATLFHVFGDIHVAVSCCASGAIRRHANASGTLLEIPGLCT
ncbi:hypothetical protein D3C78_1240670 [compost metagenome]